MMNLRSTPIVLLFVLALSALHFVNGGTNEEGLKFLKENKEKEGVVELASGLQYKILTNGTGVYHPLLDTPCSCHYKGELIDGTVFDSSYDRGHFSIFGKFHSTCFCEFCLSAICILCTCDDSHNFTSLAQPQTRLSKGGLKPCN